MVIAIHSILKITLFFSICLVISHFSSGQCAGATPITNGNCLTGQNLTAGASSGGFIAGCNGGSNPFITYSFTAPAGCVDFDISSIADNGTGLSWQYRFINAACSAVLGSGCIGQVSDGGQFTITADNTAGTYLLTSGTNYFLQIMGDNPSSFSICMSNNVEPSNACAGAFGLGTTATTYYNGSAGCAFTGTQTGGADDPAAASLCATSLQNTQWINVSPVVGASSFQVIGTGIGCSGGSCTYQFGILSSPTACVALTAEGCVANGTVCGSAPEATNSQISNAGGNVLVWSGVSASGFTSTISPASGTFNGTEKFYLLMDGNVGASCIYTLQGINVVALPIELIYFGVKKLDNANLISFEVASQINNDYFEIEKSDDAANWETITTIDGQGSSNQQQKYGFVDDRLSPTINYYRLKQTDFNGSFTYSEIVSVDNRVGDKKIQVIYNLQGQEVEEDYSGLVIIHFVDGSIEKRMNP